MTSHKVRQERTSGAVMTVTTWKSRGAAALPKADAIVLRDGSKTLGIVAWDVLVKALPGALEPTPGYPERFMASEFPEPGQRGGLTLAPWSEA